MAEMGRPWRAGQGTGTDDPHANGGLITRVVLGLFVVLRKRVFLVTAPLGAEAYQLAAFH